MSLLHPQGFGTEEIRKFYLDWIKLSSRICNVCLLCPPHKKSASIANHIPILPPLSTIYRVKIGTPASILNLCLSFGIPVKNARLPSYSRSDTVGNHPVGVLIHSSCVNNLTVSQISKFRCLIIQIQIETSTKMFTPFLIGLNWQYGPYAHFGYWTLITDP